MKRIFFFAPRFSFKRDCTENEARALRGIRDSQLMTRYEFGVAIARSLYSHQMYWSLELDAQTGTTGRERHDAMAALHREFAVELANLGIGGSIQNQENRESRVQKPKRLIVSPGFSHRIGSETYIQSDIENYVEKTPAEPLSSPQ